MELPPLITYRIKHCDLAPIATQSTSVAAEVSGHLNGRGPTVLRSRISSIFLVARTGLLAAASFGGAEIDSVYGPKNKFGPVSPC